MRRAFLAPVLCAGLLCLPVRPSEADDAPAEPEAIAAVRAALAEYDEAIKSGGADTMAVERSVLAAGSSPAFAALVEFLPHERFGPLVLHMLCARGGAALEAKVLPTYRAWPVPRRVEGARDLAAFRSDAVRAALRELAADADVSANEALAGPVRAARVRAGDPEAVAALEKALTSKEAATVAEALLLAGGARATALLARVSRLVDDKRPLPKAIPSQWPDTKTETTPDGTTTSSTIPVELGTVGEVAIEAANRICATTLPEWVAWWYEPEKGARFGRGADGVRLLKAVLAEDAKAEKAKARRVLDAIETVLASLRAGEGGPETSWKLVGVAFDKTWTITGSIDGKPSKHTVSADGKVTRS